MSSSAGASADLWKGASAWFAVRQKREKWILALALLVGVAAVTDALWLTPAFRNAKAQQSLIAQKETELAQLDAQRATLRESLRVREMEVARETELLRNQLAGITGQLAEFEKSLVPAKQMPEFLRSLLPGGGVEILTLRTLAPTPLIVRAPAETKDAAAKPDGPAANLYKHGIEITLSGSYDALLSYLSRLERSPQRVLWGHLELKADKHPRNELTLILYTLSLDPSWLVV